MRTSTSLAFIVICILPTALPIKAEETDPIGSLVAGLNEDGGWWQNGLFVPIKLPRDAKIEAVIEEGLKSQPKDSPLKAAHKILEIRKVTVNQKPFVAVLLSYPHASVVFLCEYSTADSWRSRFHTFPNEKSKPNKPERLGNPH